MSRVLSIISVETDNQRAERVAAEICHLLAGGFTVGQTVIEDDLVYETAASHFTFPDGSFASLTLIRHRNRKAVNS